MNELRAHDNQAEFQRLEEEDSWLAATNTAAGGAAVASVVIPETIAKLGSFLAGTATTSLLLKRTRKINYILRNAKVLDEALREQQIQIFVDLPVPDRGRLDLLVKIPLPPKKAIFAIAFRSQGKSTILYHEQKEALYIRHSNGGLKQWKPDQIERLALQEYWLRNNRQAELFGTSSRDRNRSAVKLLVLTGQTTVGKHSGSLYIEVGEQKVLLLRRRSSIYVLEEAQLLPFIQAWLV